MAEVASAYVSLMPSAKGFGRGISNQIGGDLDAAGKAGGKRLGSGISGGFLPSIKGLMGPVAALFAVGAVVGFFKSANAEARESQKVGALTANVIKTTGGVAKITAGQVGDLSTAISNKTGVDDEAIQHGANLLLTFKNVRNEVGKGANVFDRATAAAVDLSASGFGDVAGSSKMLGKALNDPMKGITALGRAGVTFSAGQKKQIEGFVKAGDLLSAQKIIMGEVESQVGGAAAASATAGEKLSTTWGNFKEQIGTALLPTIDTVMSKMTVLLGFLMTNVGPAFTKVSAFIAPVVTAIRGFFAEGSTGPSKFAPLVAFFKTQVVPAFASIVAAVQAFVAVALPIVQAFVAGMMARIGPMMPTIRAIFAQIGSIIVSVMGLIQAIISRVTTVISFVWAKWGTNIMNFVGVIFGGVLRIIKAALTIIQGVIKTVTSLIKGDWSGAWNGIKQILSGAWNLIKAVVSTGLSYIKGIIAFNWALIKAGVSAAWSGIKGLISSAWDGIKSAVSTKVGQLVAFVKGVPGKIVAGLGNVGTMLKDAGAKIIQGLIDGIGSLASGPIDAIKGIVGGIADFLPGSPVKKGPLRVLNRGHAGSQIVSMLAGGIDSQRAAMEASMSALVTVPRPGSLDFASSAQRSAAASGVVQHIYPTPGMSELEVGVMAANQLEWAMRGTR